MAPFKEERHHRSVSNSIGNNYSPKAANLDIHQMKPVAAVMAKQDKPVSPSKLSASAKLRIPTLAPLPPVTESRPSSPVSRKLHDIRSNINSTAPDLDEESMKRYKTYLEFEIPDAHLVEISNETWNNIQARMPRHLLKDAALVDVRHALRDEIRKDHSTAQKQAVLNYILLDKQEQERLRIHGIPPVFKPHVARGPVPWHLQLQENRANIVKYLFRANPVVLDVQKICTQYNNAPVVTFEKIMSFNYPVSVEDFCEKIKEICTTHHNTVMSNWWDAILASLSNSRPIWYIGHEKNTEELDKFFGCLSNLLSHQCKIVCERSYRELIHIFADSLLVRKDMLAVFPVIKDGKVVFACDYEAILNEFTSLLDSIYNAIDGMPSFESRIFRSLVGEDKGILKFDVTEARQEAIAAINNALLRHKQPLDDLLAMLDNFQSLVSPEFDSRVEKCMTQTVTLDEVDKLITDLNEFTAKIRDFDDYVVNGTFRMSCTQFKADLKAAIGSRLEKVSFNLRKINKNRNTKIETEFQGFVTRLNEPYDNTESLMKMIKFVNNLEENDLVRLHKEIGQSQLGLEIMMKAFCSDDEDYSDFAYTFQWTSRLQPQIKAVRDAAQMSRSETEKRISGKVITINDRIHTVAEHITRVPTFSIIGDAQRNWAIITSIDNDLIALSKMIADVNDEEGLLDATKTTFEAFNDAIALLEPFKKLWKAAFDFMSLEDKCMKDAFETLVPANVEESVNEIFKTFYTLNKNLADATAKKVAEAGRQKAEKFREYFPLIANLCNPGLRPRHWKALTEALGFEIKPGNNVGLSQLIADGIMSHVADLTKVSETATRELSFENSLKKMKDAWAPVNFDSIEYRDTGTRILSSVDEMQTLLDDQIVKVQSMRGSPFVKHIEEDLLSWERTLNYIQELIDVWLQVQATWLYLEPIFSSEDIVKQMPKEAQLFKEVDSLWRQMMKKCNADPSALSIANDTTQLGKLKDALRKLEEVQKGLNEYLEVKRLFFPRFFFLSNDELLEILSETKDPQRVQPHLKKCFEGIAGLEFRNDTIITHMISAEKEKVKVKTEIDTVLARGAVEKWLLDVEAVMKSSLRDHVAHALEAYKMVPREKFVLDNWPGQVILAVTQIYWTLEVEQALRSEDPAAVVKYRDQCTQQLEAIATLVRGELSSMARATLSALCVIDVHARDLVASFEQNKLRSTEEFQWTSQLRYYWRDDDVWVQMMNANIVYGYEYLGNSSRLVITPLTDRCYRTIISALDLNLYAGPEGPAGTGKTETTKDLAKAIAKQCVVFNCSDGLDYIAMGKFFKGLAQAGAWACFDEFNRIDLEVLSVVAQQVLTIQRAVGAKVKEFLFEGTKLILNPSCAVFITMNPGYAGRSELPDNLKALFRPVAMMVPDYALIAEISLYSCGYTSARALARKIVATFRLCSEQLSSQDHYDYGMRAVKAVLIAAGNLKIQQPNEDEQILLLRSINDTNLSKFLQQDIPLFRAITSDLFPGVVLPSPNYGGLLPAIEEALRAKKLQSSPSVIEKILQVFEMMRIRHGFMLVGEANSAKTSCYEILRDALDICAAQKVEVEKPMLIQTINPKAITMQQLYGSFDPVSHEWSDGVIANVFRDFTVSPEDHRKWCVFDGPVDAIWIENMNTVLDDNKKLCLTSGEIIQLTKSMSVVFEVRDLAVASPATVSRCGMIFFEPGNIGWDSRFKSWLSLLPARVTERQKELLQKCCDLFIPELVDSMSSGEMKTFIPRSDIELIVSACNMIEAQFSEYSKDEKPVNDDLIPSIFIYSIIWSFGISLMQSSKQAFEKKLAALISSSKEIQLPEMPSGSVFDFKFVGESGRWVKWLDESAPINIPANIPLDEAIIPTIDSIRYTNVLQLLLKYQKHICVVGPSGTGKSAYVTDLLLNNISDGPVPIFVNFSAQTSANQTQDLILSKLDKRRKGVMGPAFGKKACVFVDDINMPLKEKYGAQPPIELLRQAMDKGFWYDLKDTSVIKLVDISFVGAMAAGGRPPITSRALRHFHLLGINEFSDATMTHIFSTILQKNMTKNNFSSEVSGLVDSLVKATLSIYRKASTSLLPTPQKSHYVFNLRDISRVIKGLLLVQSKTCSKRIEITKTWTHEVYRVFYDRLSDNKDRAWFYQVITEVLKAQFGVDLKTLFPNETTFEGKDPFRSVVYSLLSKSATSTSYDEVSDSQVALNFLMEKLDEYNALSKKPLDLVVFNYAMQHISRIVRVFKQQGHILLVGVGGSGRQSLAKVASFIMDYKLFQIEISRTYSPFDWKEDLKKITKSAGLDGRQTVFLFTDTQVKYESFLEDLNNLLNTGDVPNLFPSDEKAQIAEAMRQVIAAAEGSQREVSSVYLFNYFVQRVRRNLHIVLCMSPVGDSFRNRVRLFPSLVNCCTIDWFEPWPEDALERVAAKYLEEVKISQEERTAVTKICKTFHSDAVELTDAFFAQTRRKTYVTPTFYLDLLKTFKAMLEDKRGEVLGLRNRYQNGLIQLNTAASSVAQMQVELNELKPVLIKTTAETEEIIHVVARESVEVEKKSVVVKADEEAANKKAAAAKAIKDECEAELSQAIPALEAAISALDTLKPADITLVKSMKNPPGAVKTVIEAICIMKDLKPARVKDPTGKMVDDYWAVGQKMLSDAKFLQSLKEYDKDNIPARIVQVIRQRFLPMEEFKPEIVKNSSSAAEGLCKWVLALEIYDRVAKVVAPKKEALRVAEAELEGEMVTLRSKQAELKEVQDKLSNLKSTLDQMEKKKISLEQQVDLVGKKLKRAEQLIGGLGGEKDRWTDAVDFYKNKIVNVTGDILISAATIAYLGPYMSTYRNQMLEKWSKVCVAVGIPCSLPFSFSKTLEDPVQMRSWVIFGLPDDTFSRENALILQKSRRYTLFIDPQNQANRWIRNMEKDNNLCVIKLTNDDYLRHLENAIQFGRPVLLENVGEEIDSVLEPLLSKQFVKQNGTSFIQLGDSLIEMSKDFRFYITTKLRNPHYLPEMCAKVTVCNFMITPEGLQDQLLGIVSAKEKPELEESRNKLIIQGAQNKKQLKEIEDKILALLSSGSNILEDESAVSALSSSKVVADDIQEKQKIADATEAQINETRMGYKPFSMHATVLFFVVSDMANIDNMYQNSLPWFINLYEQAIEKSDKSDLLSERVNSLKQYFTLLLYRNMCQSIFKKDKLLFSFLLASSLARERKEIAEDQWSFLLTGGMISKDKQAPNPCQWLTDETWGDIERLICVDDLKDLPQHFAKNQNEWRLVFDNSEPHLAEFPEKYRKINNFLRLLVLRSVRPDKVVPAVSCYVKSTLGEEFTEPPQFNLLNSFRDSKNSTPIIFILSPGADPTASLYTFASKQGIALEGISLGQGQGVIAEALIQKATAAGSWVVLQNCHLATSWMTTLEKISEGLGAPSVHPNFRLWLTTYPSDKFPVSILQNSIKLVNEPPNGLKANLLRSYMSDIIKDDLFKRGHHENDATWQKFLYSLCFFHAVIQERKSFGPLGWNIPYEFNETDLSISARQLYKYLTTNNAIPLEALRYITGECNYGGRCTDGQDRRLLVSLVEKYYAADLFSEDFKLTEDGIYKVPDHMEFDQYVKYIEALPSTQKPEVFGIHENGLIVRDLKETRSFLDTLLLTQSQFTSGGRSENLAIDLATSVLEMIPADFDVAMVRKKFPVTYEESMNTVLTQEVIRFNKLIRTIREGLQQTIKGLKGQIVLSADLEKLSQTMILGKVPEAWLAVSYPSLRPLSGYVSDLVDRCNFFQKWIKEGTPTIFNINAFFFTQAFFTGVMQNYARKVKMPIDTLVMNVKVLSDETPTSKPSEGAFIRGMFLEGARWDRQKMTVAEAQPKRLSDAMPYLQLVPGELSKEDTVTPVYKSPVYRTSARRGVLSTTGHSTNFVIMMNLPSDQKSSHWVHRGVALVLETSN